MAEVRNIVYNLPSITYGTDMRFLVAMDDSDVTLQIPRLFKTCFTDWTLVGFPKRENIIILLFFFGGGGLTDSKVYKKEKILDAIYNFFFHFIFIMYRPTNCS